MLTRYPTLDAVLDLKYQPVENDNPRAFTRGQIAQFNEQGFVSPVQLFAGDDLRRVQGFFRENDATIQKMCADAGAFLSLHHLLPGLYDLVTHPRTAAY